MSKLTKELLEGYKAGFEVIDELVSEIFDYIYENYKEFLNFGKYSTLEDWEIEDNCLDLKYYDRGYDIYEYCWFTGIPLDTLVNDTWKDYIQEHFKKQVEERQAKAAKAAAKEKEMRRKQYEELKREFDVGTVFDRLE